MTKTTVALVLGLFIISCTETTSTGIQDPVLVRVVRLDQISCPTPINLYVDHQLIGILYPELRIDTVAVPKGSTLIAKYTSGAVCEPIQRTIDIDHSITWQPDARNEADIVQPY